MKIDKKNIPTKPHGEMRTGLVKSDLGQTKLLFAYPCKHFLCPLCRFCVLRLHFGKLCMKEKRKKEAEGSIQQNVNYILNDIHDMGTVPTCFLQKETRRTMKC
jgi:hypothetical protein